MSTDETLIEIAPSPFRRWLAIVSLAGLSILLFSLIFRDTPDLWKLIFGMLGCFIAWATQQLWKATMDSLVLTARDFRTGSGRILTPIANVERVERGAFAFKPSNGFLVRLKEPVATGWAPGLWWQKGRRLGVGGTLSGAQTRVMADALAMQALELDRETD